MVFDFAGQNLYISTSSGLIKTFHLSTLTFGTSYDLGGSLNGIDSARDNSFLLTAQDNVGISQGVFQRVDVATGIITNIPYTLDSGEGGAWDVAIASNGLALVTTRFSGSRPTPVRQIDLATNVISIRNDTPGAVVWAPTQIHRSADGTRFFFMEGNISSGPVFTYSATSNTFGPSFDTNGYMDSASGAVNRNGNLIALRPNCTGAASLNSAPDFNFLHSFNGIDGGVAFDAIRDVFYGVNSMSDQIIAYSTATYAELFRLDIGEDLMAPCGSRTGRLVASADGGWLALETDSGIRLFQLTHPAFFNGEIALGGGWYYLQFPNSTPFGYYSYLSDPHFIYHIDLGFEYVFDPNDANHGIYFYDFASSSFFYTSPTLFPYLYNFSLNAWLYYLPDVANPGRYTHNPRWFYNFATGQWITL
jgi:hypothetical protein